MKKVLVITYYFPPAGGAGVQRTLKFVKYLREFGWDPIVLTARNADYPVYDRSLFAELPPDLTIYRAPIVEPYRLYRKFTGKRADESLDVATLSRDPQQKQKLTERFSEWVRSSFFIPDARMAWLYPAYFYGRRILKTHQIAILFSSAPPYTTHLIALKLKGYPNLPWVADFRDSWIGWLSAPQWRPTWARALERRMEEKVLQQADRVLTVTHGVKEDLLSRHPHLRDERWIHLPNGYDAADLQNVEAVPRTAQLIITYTGTLYGPRRPTTLIAALERLLQQEPQIKHKLMVRFVGRVADEIVAQIQASPSATMFEFIPYVSHPKSLSYLLATDIALLIIDDAPVNRGIITGKVYEYIGARKPIFAVAPEGEAAALIRDEGLGWVVSPGDVETCAATLQHIISHRGTLRKVSQNVNYGQYERREQTRRLAVIFDELITKGESS